MVKPGKAEKWAARSERLSAALRENLKRRKAQARSRAAAQTAEDAPPASGDEPQDGNIPSADPDFRRNPGRD
jgi:hypothetical protein